MDGLSLVEETSLSPHAAFYSSLRNKNIIEQEYEYFQKVWEENNMQTFQDFIVWYNNLGVVPFIEALTKMSQIWQERKIDMFKNSISLPGLTLKYLFSYLTPQTCLVSSIKPIVTCIISLKTKTQSGPLLSFTIIMKLAKQRVQKRREARVQSWVKKKIGYDANALYLWATCPRGAIQDA